MGNLTKINQSTRVYLDTNVYVYYFENSPDFASVAENIFSRIILQESPLIASYILLTELLVGPTKTQNKQLIQLYQNLNDKIPSIKYISLNKKISFLAAQLKAKYHLRLPDCIHLATAISQQAKYFFTNDRRLKQVKEIEVIDIHDLL